MTTLSDLVDEVHMNLLGYVIDQDQLTAVASDFTDTATQFTVSDATELSPGLAEVGDELLWVSEVDPDSNLIYVLKRGFYGSTAAAHSTGDLVRNQPRFPRHAIKRAINDVIRSVYPDLFAVSSTELTSNAGLATYELPSDLEEVLEVLYDNDDGTAYWSPLTRYRVNLHANTDAFTSGKTIDFFDGMNSGHTIQVRYRKVPTVLADGDELTDSGLQESAKETLIYGACARLIGYTEPARINDDSAEARFIDGSPAGQAMNAARYFYQMHLQAKAEETRRLLDRYPPRIHFNR